MSWYFKKSKIKLKRCSIPIMTQSLRRRLLVTQKALQTLMTDPPYILIKRLEQRIARVIYQINFKFNLQTKQAPLLPTNDAVKIANHLWNDESRTRGTRPQTIRLRKTAATVLMLASLSGSRWVDLHRLHWEDIRFEQIGPHRAMRIALRMSKNNLCNEVPQRLFWMASSSTPHDRNPILWLRRFWVWDNKPKKGLIFNLNQNSNTSEALGRSTILQVQRAAKLLEFPADKIPTKHSARVTMAVTLYNLGVESSRINRFLNWKTGRMQEHYINTRDSLAIGAPAHRLSELSSSEFSAVQQYFL